ncbi:hypothetical protein GCM10007989_24530 [Devosia pacifica]|uniref:Glycoside hydrolase family 19 catalytic domain-containing protein n=1 Tax=Devosia pacifica TaxID=1335967 RepID=A0A918S9E0_9HYPH|nr:glycoside hydrolase family 19 protein [Devosia pacifica]GHA27737.1 hypothetical protein GCM10007989_24530 [Devosia pacifica]
MQRKAFYDALRPTLGALTQANVVGFELVLDEGLRRGTALHHLAYILATAWWESGRTMQPVKEAFWLSETWRKKNLRYFPYYGRGLVQLTWEENYRKASELYGVDFGANPDLVMTPKHSVNILFDGMINGWFTGRDLVDYIDDIDEADDEDLREFANARRIVNGTDKQIEIGKLALVFEAALKAARYGERVAIPEPTPEPRPSAPSLPSIDLTSLIRETVETILPTAQQEKMPIRIPRPSPMAQVSKAVGAGKWAALASAGWTLLMFTGTIPEPYSSPEFAVAMSGFVASLSAVVGAYRAPRNAE